MGWLVQASGELYLPVEECSAGEQHYDFTDVDPVVVEVGPGSPLMPYLETLLGNFRDVYSDQIQRVNLLYRDEDDLLDLNLLRICSLENPAFDFFVRGNAGRVYGRSISPSDRHVRFHYRRDAAQPLSSVKKHTLSGTTPVRKVFGDVAELELTYIGSPNCHFPPSKDDWDVVRLWGSHEDGRNKESLREELRPYFPDIDKIDDVFVLRVLSALANSYDPSNESDLQDALKFDDCGSQCEFEDPDYSRYSDSDIHSALGYLTDKKLAIEVARGYVDAAIWKRKIKEAEQRLMGVDYHFLDDPVSAGILLLLIENGSGRFSDLYSSAEQLGLESEGTLDDKIADRLRTLSSQDVIRETNGIYEITDRHIRPRIGPGQLVLTI